MESARKIATSRHGTGKIQVINYSNISRMYGSIHCSTQVISRVKSDTKNETRVGLGENQLENLPPLWPVSTLRDGKPKQSSDYIMMCPPTGFLFNPQTAQDNSFMKQPTLTKNEIHKLAMKEYSFFHQMLTTEFGINVHVAINGRLDTPDAISLNNWFSTHAEEVDGKLITKLVLYPMRYPSRRLERIPETLLRLRARYT